jgi:hypothetical protein
MKRILIITLLFTLTTAFAHEATTNIHSYYESKSFKNSVQKNDGNVIGLGANIMLDKSSYKFTYEHGDTNTKKPPMKKDLRVDKLFLKYAYTINDYFKININYINILNDNIAPTAHGKAYALGISYNFNKKTLLNFTQFITNYKKFNVYQSEFTLEHKIKIKSINSKLSVIGKRLHLDNEDDISYSKNAKKDYSTLGLKLHSHYNLYHLGFGAFFGKRAFAIMQNGFKIQHHAMEFDRTYAIGAGKTFDKLTLRVQYVYQRAIELPTKNTKEIDVQNIRLLANYKF